MWVLDTSLFIPVHMPYLSSSGSRHAARESICGTVAGLYTVTQQVCQAGRSNISPCMHPAKAPSCFSSCSRIASGCVFRTLYHAATE